MPFVQRADYAEHESEPPRIVADAGSFHHVACAFDRDVRAFGKDRVEVSSEDQIWVRALARPHSDHIPGLIDPDILKVQLFEESLQFQAALFFVERRSGDLADADLQI